jgi:mitogen-activated protein kinase kinase kinase
MSATYIPHAGDSFGVGVGIPALSSYNRSDSAEYSAVSERSTSRTTPDTGLTTPLDEGPNSFYADRDRLYHAQTPVSRHNNTGMHIGTREANEYNSPGPPTATPSSLQAGNGAGRGLAPTLSSVSTMSNQSGAANSSSNHVYNEAAAQWPLDRVLLWLANNQFSNDWQETFKALDVHGASFLELGSGHGGRGNFGMMHQQVYPRLAKECSSSGTGWDQAREREEGKRMRRLIREIATGKSSGAPRSSHGRRDSGAQNTYKEGAEGALEPSPNLGRDNYVTTPSTANGEDDSPGKSAFKEAGPGFGMRRVSQNRSTTFPVLSSSFGSNEDGTRGNHRNILKSADTDSARRHSPSMSGEFGDSAHFKGAALRADSSPQSGSPGPYFPSPYLSTNNGNLSASPHSGKFGHRARGSTDSVSSSTAIYGSGVPPGANQILGDMGAYSRRHGTDGSRPSPLDSGFGERSASIEPPSSAKERKGFLQHFRKKKPKEDGMFPSPEDQNLESPTSPSMSFKPAQYGQNPKAAASESMLAMFPDHTHRGRRGSPGKLYILATMDGLNFRLCDITDIETGHDLRHVIAWTLGMPDASFAQFYLTDLGRPKTDHDELLDDSKLLACKLTRADASGNLKMYVVDKSSGLPSIGGAEVSCCLSQPFDDGLRRRSNSSPPSSRQNTVKGQVPSFRGPADMAQQNGGALRDRLGQLPSSHSGGGETHLPESEKQAFFDQAAKEYRAQAELRGREYQIKKKAKLEEDALAGQSPGIKGRTVDFDQPRQSPFEDKKTDVLFPQRKPPAPPGESATLIKVNSLSKKQHGRPTSADLEPMPTTQEMGERTRKKKDSSPSTGGIGAALVGMGARLGHVGHPTPKPGSTSKWEADSNRNAMSTVDFGTSGSGRSSPKSASGTPGSLTWGKGDTPFKVPDYAGQGDDSAQNAIFAKMRHEELRRAASPVDLSPSSAHTPQSGLSIPGNRKSYGPNVDFDEPDVPFEFNKPAPSNPVIQLDDSDDDSDDGLFAVPINKQKQKAVDLSGDEHSDGNSKRPSLTVNTRAKKGVSWGAENSYKAAQTSENSNNSSHLADVEEETAASARSTQRSRRTPASAASEGWSANSSEDMSKILRRESFAREDVWASRPPAEALINHLDDFFPNLDLDQPVLEEGQDTPPSPIMEERSNLGGMIAAQSGLSIAGASNFMKNARPDSTYSESDTLGSDESTLKALERPTSIQSVAQRNIRRSGGLGRMKSIREVARGAHEANKRFTAPTQQGGSTSILRRKSTKMFGANIVQIKPQRGSMLLPQIPQDTIPKRTATFRWFKGQLIGKGTYGRVYLGMNATTGEFLAVKQVEVNAKAAANDKNKMKELVAALDLEIDTMKDLDHVNIVQYLGCERKETSISIFLEYISGGSVGSCLRKHGKFEEPVVSSLTRQTLAGLAYLHGKGILHRDLKADNILLDLDGTCKISDFGISKKTDNIYGNDASNNMQGSVFWMAPEVVRSHGQGYSAKVDIWSLGCVVLEMFAGRRPWSKEEAVGAIYKLGSLNEAPPIPDDVSDNISAVAVAFMADCFQMYVLSHPS